MMNEVFDLCVRILLALADVFGTSYKAINVWIFVIIWPAFTLFLLAVVYLQHRKIRRLSSQSSGGGTAGG